MNFRVSIGDLVQLKSGGQIMTVHNLSGDRLSCIWHDCEGRFQEAAIDKRALQIASLTDSRASINLNGASGQPSEQVAGPYGRPPQSQRQL
jgi:uncharacterized protein YodC (DUF2158 family)